MFRLRVGLAGAKRSPVLLLNTVVRTLSVSQFTHRRSCSALNREHKTINETRDGFPRVPAAFIPRRFLTGRVQLRKTYTDTPASELNVQHFQ